MARIGTREVGRFWTVGTSGRRYMLIETEPLYDVRTHDDLTAPPTGGLHSLRTAEGQTVNPIANDQFQILQTGEVLTRF